MMERSGSGTTCTLAFLCDLEKTYLILSFCLLTMKTKAGMGIWPSSYDAP